MSYKSYSPYESSRFSKKSARWSKVQTIIAVGFIIFAVLAGGITMYGAVAVSGTSTGCVVKDKDRSTGYKGRSDMRVYTEGCNGSSEGKVFQVSDNWFAGQFASADTYAKIEVGKTYNFETRGMRIPILSTFENIVGVTAK
jgi:hypothetical protein